MRLKLDLGGILQIFKKLELIEQKSLKEGCIECKYIFNFGRFLRSLKDPLLRVVKYVVI